MIFVYKKWEAFCEKLAKSGKYSITAAEVADGNCEENYLVLKHDVETDVKKAFHIAEIEKNTVTEACIMFRDTCLKIKIMYPC